MQSVVDNHVSAIIRHFISQRRVPEFVLAARASSRSSVSGSESNNLLPDPRQLDQLLEEAAFICREVELFDLSLRTAARDAWIALKRSAQYIDSTQTVDASHSYSRARALQLMSDFSLDSIHGAELKRSNLSTATMVTFCVLFKILRFIVSQIILIFFIFYVL